MLSMCEFVILMSGLTTVFEVLCFLLVLLENRVLVLEKG